MSKRVVVLTDEELDLLLVWHESLEVEADRDEEDDELAEKLRALQAGRTRGAVVLILGLLLLLALLRCAYLEVENRRLAAGRDKLLREMHRSASQLRAMAAETRRVSHEARVTDEIATAMAANLRPVGNVDLVPSNVVAFPGLEKPGDE